MVIRYKKEIIRGIVAIVAIVCTFAALSSGYYVDENGTIAIYRGIYMGQHMFADTWESLQTGAIITYPLFALYYECLQPVLANCGIGLILYLRIMYTICRLIIACYLYCTLRFGKYKKGAFVAATIYFLFVVGWHNFSYKSICDMAVMLVICFILRYRERQKNFYFALVGIATSIAILAYPSMLIFAVAIGVGMIIALRQTDLSVNALWCFVISCVVCGALFLLYLQLTTGLDVVFSQIRFIGDQDYDYSFPVRILRMLAMYVAFGVVAYLPIAGITLFKRYRYMSGQMAQFILCAYWTLFFVGICAIKLSSVSISRLIYAFIILFFWFPYLVYQKKENDFVTIGAHGMNTMYDEMELWIIFIISGVVQFVWAISTNQDITVPGTMALYAVIALVLLFSKKKRMMQILSDVLLVATAFFAIVWVPESNGGMAHVFEKRYIVERGALEGVCVQPDYYYLNEACMNLVEEYVTNEDYLLVTFGSNSTGYINSVGKIAGHTVYDRTQVNTKVLTFWEQHPDHQAKYVLLNRANSKYDDFVAGETGQYILSTYTKQLASEGDLVLLTMP